MAAGYTAGMIVMTFADAADSPTGAARVRLRYAIHRRPDGSPVPVLQYRTGAAELTRAAWEGYRMAGAILSVDTERERGIVREVLGDGAVL